MIQTLKIIQPDDFHIHLRQQNYLKDTVRYAEKFKKILVMPNLTPPIVSIQQAKIYREEILFYSKNNSLEPYMTLYLNKSLSKQELFEFRDHNWLLGIKLYPSGVTTHSEYGIDKIEEYFSYFELMEKLNIPLLVHAEVNDDNIDFFDREKVFIDLYLSRIRNVFPELKIVLEHVSSKEGVEFVLESQNIAATITPHHLLLTRNDLFLPRLNPHHYCLPVLKTKEDRDFIAKVVLSGNPKFFAGTDSAPHPVYKKECSSSSAGIFTSPIAIELYITFFEKNRCLDKTVIENFLSVNGSKFYHLPINQTTITIVKEIQKIPESYPLGNDKVIPMWANRNLTWKVISN